MTNTHSSLRVAAIGVGHLGRHHARLLASLDEATLVAVVDAKPDRAREVAAACGTTAVDDPADLIGRVDAVSVAVPTESHLEVALPFLERGIPVLVEKPLARDVREADRMIDAAARTGAILAVGHTERHNPAVAVASAYLAAPRFIEVHRLGTFPERSLDIDVVFDLMIHDLDIVLALVPSAVVAIEAVGVPVLTGRVDIANVRLRFENGCIANMTASRISRDRVRKIRFFQQDAYLSIDYAAQEVEMYRLLKDQGRPVIDGGKLEVAREEPLRRELADFLAAVRHGRRPLVAGEDGRRAIVLAQRIVERMDAGV
ncbi:MAG TPA: Gfo/Idh/MocA family oxidoreductase [Vicinamibacterales bacterium]|nr:Gfo/Idh/MocA family oxidoreductase [Vicinamibacterales bacterium]